VQYAAFLRAINVGKHNRVTMVALRESFAAAGLREVATYLQTGNVLFEFEGNEAEAVAAIDGAMLGHGLRNASASVRTRAELAELLGTNPFSPGSEPKNRFVTLYQAPIPAGAATAIASLPNVVSVRAREVLVERPADALPGDNGAALAKLLPLQGTARYWHIVEEVARLLAAR
jgi:uncharacterized protein (DUF1697 family)